MINIKIIIFFFILTLFVVFTYRIENFSDNIFDKIGNKLVFSKQSNYQKIQVYQQNHILVFFDKIGPFTFKLLFTVNLMKKIIMSL